MARALKNVLSLLEFAIAVLAVPPRDRRPRRPALVRLAIGKARVERAEVIDHLQGKI